MIRHAACAFALALSACDASDCPGVFYVDGFTLLIEDADWNMARYSIEVSYADRFGAAAFRCDVAVPSITWSGSIDAGFALVPDGGVDTLGNFQCRPVLPTGRRSGGQAGQALLLTFEGTPGSVHLIISDNGTKVLEQDLTVPYQKLHHYGEDCDSQTLGAIRVKLP